MKNTQLKLALMAAGALALSGCSAILPGPKNIETSNGSTVQLTYQDPADAQQCQLVKEVAYNPNSKILFSFIHIGPNDYDAIKLSDDYFVNQAQKLGANYINRDTVSDTEVFGIYGWSNDIDAVLYNCASLDARPAETAKI